MSQTRRRRDPNNSNEHAASSNKDYGTQVVYALVLEHLKRATGLTVQNADAERTINKKANLNYRLIKQIEESKREEHSGSLGSNRTQQAKNGNAPK